MEKRKTDLIFSSAGSKRPNSLSSVLKTSSLSVHYAFSCPLYSGTNLFISNAVLGITNDFLYTSYSKICIDKNHDITKSRQLLQTHFTNPLALHYIEVPLHFFKWKSCKDSTDSQNEYLLWITCALLQRIDCGSRAQSAKLRIKLTYHRVHWWHLHCASEAPHLGSV